MTTRRIHIRHPEPGEVCLSGAEVRVAVAQSIQAAGSRFILVRMRDLPRAGDRLARARQAKFDRACDAWIQGEGGDFPPPSRAPAHAFGGRS